MRILMFGWEFPPRISGGLGTASFGLTGALAGFGHRIFFVVPKTDAVIDNSDVSVISAAGHPFDESAMSDPDRKYLQLKTVDSSLLPYIGDSQYRLLLEEREYKKNGKEQDGSPGSAISGTYGSNLRSEVLRYGRLAGAIAREHSFDIIHAHDWMTIPAGLHARTISGKPLVLHIHSLEFDRSGENINQEIYDLERQGMHAADSIITVSHYARGMIVDRYGVNAEKVSVVYNAATRRSLRKFYRSSGQKKIKTVLFLGRITFQKGPEYFIEAAARVLKFFPEVRFVMAGAGDRMDSMIEKVAGLRIGRNFHFTGFLGATDVERIFALSDLYVMPSVSEPFGITPLEALLSDVPVIISRQSGVSEILSSVLKVNFWDIEEMADQMIAVLKHPPLVQEMMRRASEEIKRISWKNSAVAVNLIYSRLLAATRSSQSQKVFPCPLSVSNSRSISPAS